MILQSLKWQKSDLRGNKHLTNLEYLYTNQYLQYCHYIELDIICCLIYLSELVLDLENLTKINNFQCYILF